MSHVTAETIFSFRIGRNTELFYYFIIFLERNIIRRLLACPRLFPSPPHHHHRGRPCRRRRRSPCLRRSVLYAGGRLTTGMLLARAVAQRVPERFPDERTAATHVRIRTPRRPLYPPPAVRFLRHAWNTLWEGTCPHWCRPRSAHH